jgi:hypothetical protein
MMKISDWGKIALPELTDDEGGTPIQRPVTLEGVREAMQIDKHTHEKKIERLTYQSFQIWCREKFLLFGIWPYGAEGTEDSND